jgi:hypothetical protein
LCPVNLIVGDGNDDVRGALKVMSSSLRSLLLGGSIMTGDAIMVHEISVASGGVLRIS